MSLWSSVLCQAVLLSLSRPERSPQEVFCVDCNETSGAALLPVVRGPLLLCHTLAVTVCLLLVVVFCTAFHQPLRWARYNACGGNVRKTGSARYSD